MSSKKSNKAFLGTSILLAITSSLCCIAPLLAIVGGIGGFASSLSWVEPLRPYLIALTIVVLGLGFYQAYKPVKVDNCGCSTKEKKSLLESKKFLWIITIVSTLLISFPYYSKVFSSPVEKNNITVDKDKIGEAVLHIEGMSCQACEGHVIKALMSQPGVIEATSSYEDGIAKVKFDKSKNSPEELAAATETETGYKVKP